MPFRDYMYLDTYRLQNYVSDLEQGVVEQFIETTREQSGKEGGGKVRAHFLEAGGAGRSEEETTRERTIRITAQNMFSRVYAAMEEDGEIKIFDEDDDLTFGTVRRRDIVEITRNFSPSPLNDMIDSMLHLIQVMEEMGFTEEIAADQEEAQAVRAMAMLFQGDEGGDEVPMVSRSSRGDASVLFLAHSRYILVDQDAFKGDMTVFGRVRKLIPEGESQDLIDFLKLPSAMRGESEVRKALLELFQSWPKELGGPVSEESLEVRGPLLIITPVAVYEA